MTETLILQAHDDVVQADYIKTRGRGGVSNTSTQAQNKPAQQKKVTNNNTQQANKQQQPKTGNTKPEPPTKKASDGTDVKCLTCYQIHRDSKNRWWGSHGDDGCWVLHPELKPEKFKQKKVTVDEVGDEDEDPNKDLNDAFEQAGVTGYCTEIEYHDISNMGFTEPKEEVEEPEVCVAKKIISEDQVETKKEAKAAKKQRQRLRKQEEARTAPEVVSNTSEHLDNTQTPPPDNNDAELATSTKIDDIIWDGVVGTVSSPTQPGKLTPIIPVRVKRRLGERDTFDALMYCDSSSQMNMISKNLARKHNIFVNYSDASRYWARDIQGKSINIIYNMF